MALGFDMKDPVIDPDAPDSRVADWIEFFKTWDRKPEFVGRYFGRTHHPWVRGEVTNAKSLVPNNFDNLRYVVPFSTSGPELENKRVDINGEVVAYGGYPVFYNQVGLDEKGEKRTVQKVRLRGRIAGRDTCKAIAKQIERLSGRTFVLDDADLELSVSGQVFVFLHLEPWVKLHPHFWRGWAQEVRAYHVNLGTTSKPKLVQPFRPSIYCSVGGSCPPHPKTIYKLWCDSTKKIFEDAKAPRCYALATGWNPGPEKTRFKKDTTGESKIAGLDATEVQAKIWMPTFDVLEQKNPDGKQRYPEAYVVLWQYFLDHKFKEGFKIDFSITPDIEFNSRPITDYFLRIRY